MLRLSVLAAFAIALLMIPLSSEAEDTEGGMGCGWNSPCSQDPYDAEETGTQVTRCTDSYGCPACALNNDRTWSVCYVLAGAWGSCSCTPQQPYYDSAGVLRPRCAIKGSCTIR